jgi:hypothetical protein
VRHEWPAHGQGIIMRTAAVCIALALSTQALSAQGTSPPRDWSAVQRLAPGTTVRIASGSRRATGTVQAATDTSVTVTNESGEAARFDRADVDLVEEVFGHLHPRRRGAIKGALWSSLLVIPATVSTEMGGMERKYLPLTYCMIVCTGAAIGAWVADAPQKRVVYSR